MATAFSSRAHGESTARRGGDRADGASVGKRTLTEQLPVSGAPVIQRKLQLGDVGSAAAGVGAAQDRSAGSTGGGAPLPAHVRAPMEQSFGADFSRVRIHQDASADAMGASAYARGDDVHFAPGHYDPDSQHGRELIGHELAHVVQQRQGRVQATTQARGEALNDDTALEREADDHGARAARGERVATGGTAARDHTSAAGPIQRSLFWPDNRVYRRNDDIPVGQMLRDGRGGGWYRYVAAYPGGGKVVLKANNQVFTYSFETDLVTAYSPGNHEVALGFDLGDRMMDINDTLGDDPARGIHYEHTYRQKFPNLWQREYDGGYADPRYFDRPEPMHWQLKPGQSASGALRAWLAGLTIAECATTLVALQLRQLMQVVGPGKFDRMFGGTNPDRAPTVHLLRINEDISDCVPVNMIKGGGVTENHQAELRLGAKYYFQNHPAYLLKHPDGALTGENSVYVGERHGQHYFAGLGIGPVTAREMCETLREAYNDERTERDYQFILIKGSGFSVNDVRSEAQRLGSFRAVYERYLDEVDPRFKFGDRLPETLTWQQWVAGPDVGMQGQGVMLSIVQMMTEGLVGL